MDIFAGSLEGLSKLHDMAILHRDLKSANIFLDKNNKVKLGDMNVSKISKLGLVINEYLILNLSNLILDFKIILISRSAHKLELLITPHQKFGTTKDMGPKVIFGHLDVSCMSYAV